MIRETWLFTLRKAFDKVQFIRQNTSYYFDPANAISKAANADVSEAIFYSEKVVAEDANGFLISADGLFISEKLDPIKPFLPPSIPPGAVFNLGSLNSSKSSYLKLRSFPNNTDVVVSLAYENPSPIKFGGKDITDARYVQVKMQHSFLEVPNNDYKPRRDDPRVGYFTLEVDDMTATRFPNYKDVITRWHLVKKDKQAAISEPVEPIVWWIENTTPVEIRDVIMQAGLKWNEAFEKAGFRNAVVMKQTSDTASWDPADIRYNVIRWVSSDLGYAIGPSFVNPRTGQILGADITFDFGFLPGAIFDNQTYDALIVPGEQESIINPYLAKHKHCTMAKGMQLVQTSALTMLEAFDASAEELSTLKDQYIGEVVMHELGHTMGLNHNMKTSTMLGPKEIHNRDITRQIGLMGSVMDYSIVNLISDKSKQGDYYTTKTGPYDWWAIEFGYSQFTPDKEEEAINKILSKSTDPKLTFGNDADITEPGRGIDPRVMTGDMSGDAVAYAEDRFKTVNSAMARLKERFIKPGQSYEDLRARYYSLNANRIYMALSLSSQIGGIYVDRSFPEQKSNSKPFTPVPAAYQRSAMQVLSNNVFSPKAFDADAQLYPYLQQKRRGFNFFGYTEDPKMLRNAARIQNIVLDFVLHPVTLNRSTSTTLYGNTYTDADIVADMVKACFKEDMGTSIIAFRQTLQTELVRRMLGITNDAANRYETSAKSAAYYNLKNLKASLAAASSIGDTQTKAHRTTLIYLIDKGLSTTK